jgi:hypothetical protein
MRRGATATQAGYAGEYASWRSAGREAINDSDRIPLNDKILRKLMSALMNYFFAFTKNSAEITPNLFYNPY